MPDPMDRTLFDAQLDATGLPLTLAERDAIHAATAHLMPMLARLRRDLPMALEPAPVFTPVFTPVTRA